MTDNQGASHQGASQPAHGAAHVSPNPYQATYGAGSAHPAHQAAPAQGAGSTGPAVPQPPASGPSPAPCGPQGPKRSGSSLAKTFLIAFAGALVACVLAFGVAGVTGVFDHGGATIGSTTSSTVDAQDEDATLAEAVSSKCLPSVAAIDVYSSSAGGYEQLLGGSRSGGELVQSSLGSGVVLSEDGYIITNYHVIEGGSAYKVTIAGDTYDADVVGSDPSSDIAVLKARDAKGLTPIEIGDSDNLKIGEWVMSIGSPFGLEQSVATGIVSATSRSQIMSGSTDAFGNSTGDYTMYPNMIQTDAAINPGNSGGALVDADGKLIGINTLITSYSGNYSGVGFAIPVNYAVSLAQQIINGEEPTHAQLGVSLVTVNSQLAQRYGLPVNEGAYVSSVAADSGAESAGIEEGDIITAFDGAAVSSASDLMLDVRTKNPGDEVVITVNRGGKTQDITVTLGSDESTAKTQQQSESTLLDALRQNSQSEREAA